MFITFNNNINAFVKIIYSKIQLPFHHNLIEFYNKCIYSVFDEYHLCHLLILIMHIVIHS